MKIVGPEVSIEIILKCLKWTCMSQDICPGKADAMKFKFPIGLVYYINPLLIEQSVLKFSIINTFCKPKTSLKMIVINNPLQWNKDKKDCDLPLHNTSLPKSKGLMRFFSCILTILCLHKSCIVFILKENILFTL